MIPTGYGMGMDQADIQTATVYVPRRELLSRRIFTLGAIGFAWFAIYAGCRWYKGDPAYFASVFPVHVLLAGMIGAYLVYLDFMLFHTLARGYRIERRPSGLVVEAEGRIHRLDWEDIRGIRFGDVYLTIASTQGTVQVPFIPREAQREIYRCHQRARGLVPDPGRFLPPPRRVGLRLRSFPGGSA